MNEFIFILKLNIIDVNNKRRIQIVLNNNPFRYALLLVLFPVIKTIINIKTALIIIISILFDSSFSMFNIVKKNGIIIIDIRKIINDFNSIKKVFIISPNKYYLII